ncbi:transmembrane protein 268-like isoform X1 [Varroa destructor]|uniref:Transmembrane protein 268 n=1 Tax=Varroa destructor TaxID=109461 RepID=A0A7M7J1I5_VARDE|nr:transmembrane protein 268-like isoform X1 [Varroa destructor]XP_022644782.1 transmembrane protein 268-like isoform X1 [Varroa destructor]
MLVELGEDPSTGKRTVSKREYSSDYQTRPPWNVKMMSESGGTENPGMSTGVTSLENDRALDQDNLKRHWIEQPPAQSIGESKVRIARNKKDTTWVRFEEDDGSEGAATIQPSSIEVVATKALQQQAIIKDAKWGTTSSGTSEQAKNNANLQQKDQSEIRIEPMALRPSPPRSPVAIEPPPSGSSTMWPNLSARRNSQDKFLNGDVICTVLPSNKSCAWVTRAKFKPNLVPEEIMDTNLTITVEDYVLALQILTNDLRFTLYNILYKRILLMWMLMGFVILLSLLFSGTKGLALFGGGVFWLIVNAVGIFAFMYIKLKLYHMLERCIAHVNQILVKHKILLGLDDRGKLSCHKVHLIFLYFDTEPCIKYLCAMLEEQEKADTANEARENPVVRSRMDIGQEDNIFITRGSVTERLSQKEKTAEKLLLRYSQRWVKSFVRKRLDLNVPIHPDAYSTEPASPEPPRHCSMARCLCQVIEEHLCFKPLTKCTWSELCC